MCHKITLARSLICALKSRFLALVAIASAPLFIIGWTMLIYGVVECINAFKIANNKRKWAKAEEVSSAAGTTENGSYIEEIKEEEEKKE